LTSVLIILTKEIVEQIDIANKNASGL